MLNITQQTSVRSISVRYQPVRWTRFIRLTESVPFTFETTYTTIGSSSFEDHNPRSITLVLQDNKVYLGMALQQDFKSSSSYHNTKSTTWSCEKASVVFEVGNKTVQETLYYIYYNSSPRGTMDYRDYLLISGASGCFSVFWVGIVAVWLFQ